MASIRANSSDRRTASSLALSTFIAEALFCSWDRSFWQETTMPVGMCDSRTAESVVLTPWPAGPVGAAQVHPEQHLGEVGRVHPARAGPDGDQRLPDVVLAGEQGADLELVDRLGQDRELAQHLGRAVRVGFGLRQLE